MSNPWFRLYEEFSTDPKVQMMSEANQRRLIMLFCFRCNAHVTLPNVTETNCNVLHDDEVSFQLRISNDEWLATKAIFIAKGFIDDDNNVCNWDKRQFISDSSKSRVATHRERKKQEKSVDCNKLPESESNKIEAEKDVTLQDRYCNTPRHRTESYSESYSQADINTHTPAENLKTVDEINAASVCVLAKQSGIAHVNPAHAQLIALVSAGVSVEVFVSAISIAVEKRKGFAYMLGVAKSQHDERAQNDLKKQQRGGNGTKKDGPLSDFAEKYPHLAAQTNDASGT